MDKLCVDCGGRNVHAIEFRMDYSNARSLSPVNIDTEELDEDEVPGYLGGYYCHDCGEFCSIKEAE